MVSIRKGREGEGGGGLEEKRVKGESRWEIERMNQRRVRW